MKVWEAVMMVLDFSTGKLVEAVAPHTFQGVNFQQAQETLLLSGITFVKLSGRTINKPLLLDEGSVEEDYKKIIHPPSFVKNMTIDEFCDWLTLGTEEDVKATLKEFEKHDLPEHIKVIEGHLKHFYGNKD